jgi:Spy/CpxP family protein refolding chaperone
MKTIWFPISLILIAAFAICCGYIFINGVAETKVGRDVASNEAVNACSDRIGILENRFSDLEKAIAGLKADSYRGTPVEKKVYKARESENPDNSGVADAPAGRETADAKDGTAPDITAAAEECAKQLEELKKEMKDLKSRTPEVFMGGPGDFRKHRAELLQKKTEISDSVRDEIMKIWEEYEKKRREIMKEVMAKVVKSSDGEDTMMLKFPPDDPEIREKLKRIEEDEDNAVGRLLTSNQYEEYKKWKKEPMAFGFSVASPFGGDNETGGGDNK